MKHLFAIVRPVRAIVALTMLLFVQSAAIAQGCDQVCLKGCSRTFFRPRSLSQSSFLELGLSEWETYHRCRKDDKDSWLDFQSSVFYFHSTNRDTLARNFLPCCKDCISVEEDNTADISSLWLGIITPGSDTRFQSDVVFRPRRQATGATFKFRINFGGLTDNCFWEKMYASLYFPIVHVRHELGFKEVRRSIDGQLEGFANVGQALTNAVYNFGRLCCGKLTETGVDDLQFKIGYDICIDEVNHYGAYFVLFVPTGHESDACYLFEPTMGSGGHLGVGLGINDSYRFWENECGDHALDILFDLRWSYFFKDDECRSFDLKNCEWSRYMRVVNREDTTVSFPAINFLTANADVVPRNTIDIWLAAHYNCCNWNLEIGYDFYWKQAEDIRCARLCSDICDGNIGIFDIVGVIGCEGAATTASRACINASTLVNPEGQLSPTRPASDPEFTPITPADINCFSAAQRAQVSSTIYGACSYDWYVRNLPGMIGFGVSYEIAHKHSTLSQAGIWGKLGISF